jgi:outer membrane protein assembly factor BamD (BamD/ComL family)
VKPESKTSSASALAAELGALDAVRARLSSGDASGALAKLDEYARTYPRGRLVLEAEVLRIDALAKNGQHSAAKKRAESFLTRHPKSVLASRVRGYLD